MNITFFFRTKGYSIEMVFHTIINHLKKDPNNNIQILNLKFSDASIKSIIGNILQTYKNTGEINHITGDIHYITLLLPKERTILTIHDCIMVERNSGLKRFIISYLWLILPGKKSKYITTISEKSKSDIIKYTGINPEKIFVIHNPVNPIFQYSFKEFNKSRPRILHFTNAAHKNTERVIEALEGLNITLVLIGAGASQHYQKTKTFQVETYQNLSTPEIVSEYEKSDIVLFPSWFEGFGMPIIEAQAVGRVVITSNIAPMTEVAGEGAHFVDPYSVESIRSGVQKVIEDSQYRKVLIQLGTENVNRFSVEHITLQYLELYKQMGGGK